MTGLRLGPLLRYVDWDGDGTATIWVEADRPSTAEVRCEDGAYGTSRTFHVAGHHYALIPVTGLTPGTATPYEVFLDGRRVWPPEDSPYPPSTIHTPAVPLSPSPGTPSGPGDSPESGTVPGELRVSFGSCRWASPPHGEPDPVGPDALDTLATHLATHPDAIRPDVLLLLGDQVYADETSKATQRRMAERRVDSRAARVLDEQHRAMLNEGEARWVGDQVLDGRGSMEGPYDHLLIGTSLPWLLPPFIHDLESWNSALCHGERGPRWARFGERLRRAADLEHWAAFPDSFEELAALIAEAGSGPGAPATVCVLSGDVHHAYVAEPSWQAGDPDARVLQLTCSPVHNSVPAYMKLGFRFGWSWLGRRLGHSLIRHGRVGPSSVNWGKTGGPWFGNQLMTLTMRGRSAGLRLDHARAKDGGAELVTVQERTLTTT
nr:hypothetical protein OH820_09130 [Streptomyces sp. NBC_00857]